MTIKSMQISCIILAGGEGKRVDGQDKGLILYKNKPLIEYVIDAIQDQVDDIVISANRNIETYKQYTKNVIHDSTQNYSGPLSGIAACLTHCNHELVLIVACDMPELPTSLVERLVSDIHKHSLCIATVNNNHQLAMIIKKDLLGSVQQSLDNNQLKLISWIKSISYKTISFDDIPDAFVNLNKL